MCGRYTDIKPDYAYRRFEVARPLDFNTPKYNIAPGMLQPIITRNSPNKATLMKWGLVPFWAKDPKIGYKMINARAEGIADKPAFRKPLRTQRCIVPATGFYEWKKLDDKKKQPYYFFIKDEEMFGFAGLYDIWKDVSGKEFYTYTIITTTPNELMTPIHDRMPVILPKDAEDLWLDPDINDPQPLAAMLKPYPSEKMEKYPVSTDVGNTRNDSPNLIQPI